MGAICVPSYANNLMSELKENLPYQKQISNILTLHKRHFYGMD